MKQKSDLNANFNRETRCSSILCGKMANNSEAILADDVTDDCELDFERSIDGLISLK